MKRVVQASDGFVSPNARSVANQLYTKLSNVLNFLDEYEDYLESLLDDPGFYDAVFAEVQRLGTILKGANPIR